MTLTKVLWAALTGALTVICLLAGAWAQSVTSQQATIEQRLSIAEQHYAAIQADMQDTREQIREIKAILQERNGGSH